eukprot:519719_1
MKPQTIRKHENDELKSNTYSNELAVYQSCIYGNSQLLLHNSNSEKTRSAKTIYNANECAYTFEQCNATENIKSVLEEYKKIISDKNEPNECKLSNKIHALINNKLFNANYSDVKLLNDFFHVKYNHNTNDDPDKMNLLC